MLVVDFRINHFMFYVYIEDIELDILLCLY